MAGGEVRATGRPRVATVGREPPDVGPAAGPRGEPMAEREDGVVVKPGGGEEEGPAAGHRRVPPRGDVHHRHVRSERDVAAGPPVGGEGDPGAVRRPGGSALGSRTAGQAGRLAGPGVDEPEVGLAIVDEAGPVEEVAEPVQVAVVRGRRDARLARTLAPGPCIGLAIGGVRRGRHDQAPAVGRPGEAIDAARQVGQAACLAALEREQIDLDGVLALGRLDALGRVLEGGPPVRQEGERPAIGRESGVAVVLGADRQLAGRCRAVGRHRPQRVAIAVEGRGDGLQGEDDGPTVRAEARIERHAEPVEVVGARRTRHRGSPRDGTSGTKRRPGGTRTT